MQLYSWGLITTRCRSKIKFDMVRVNLQNMGKTMTSLVAHLLLQIILGFFLWRMFLPGFSRVLQMPCILVPVRHWKVTPELF